MLFKEKKAEEKVVNPYPWPKNYYMDSEPEARRAFLEKQLLEDAGEEMQKISALFETRYEKNKKQRYVDTFMRGFMDLLVLKSSLTSPFSAKKNRRAAVEALHIMCVDRKDEFGETILYDELCHLIGVYVMSCLSDSSYQSVILNIGKMKEEKVKEKIMLDLLFVAHTVPERLEMQEEFAFFTKAVDDMGSRLL